MIELVYQKGKFDLNRSVIEEIQKKDLIIINLMKWVQTILKQFH